MKRERILVYGLGFAVSALLRLTSAAAAGELALVSPAPEKERVSGRTDKSPKAVTARYGSQPGGFTLEGVATGIEAVKTVRYEKKGNIFVLNDGPTYVSPIPVGELGTLAKALAKDDRIGVSLDNDLEAIPYGALVKKTDLVNQLLAADKVLGGVIFARLDLIEGIELPGKYQPKAAVHRTIRNIIHANATSFSFKRDEKRDAEGRVLSVRYLLNACDLTLDLIRVSSRLAPDGGFLPEEDPVLRKQLQPEDVENLKHIQDNQAAYLALPPLAHALHIGEAAAFLRYLRDSGTDLAALAKTMR